MPQQATRRSVEIPDGSARLDGDLRVPFDAQGLVIFAHGSSRFSPRNRQIAEALDRAGFATLLLLVPAPPALRQRTRCRSGSVGTRADVRGAED